MNRDLCVQQITPIVDTKGQQIRNNEGGILCQILENDIETLHFINENVLEEIPESQEKNSRQELNEVQNESENLTQDNYVDSIRSPTTKMEWGDEDTRLLLDIYSSELSNVGPLKKFRKKKDLWNHISLQIEKILKLKRSATQCETRYKTVLKRKTEQDTQNKTSGQIRCPVSFENEINKIKDIDDSIEPEILLSANNIRINKTKDKELRASTSKKKEKEDLLRFFQEMHREKEANKERRHQEKLKLLKDVFKNEHKKKDEHDDNN